MLACRNVLRVVERMREQSRMLGVLVREERIAIVGSRFPLRGSLRNPLAPLARGALPVRHCAPLCPPSRAFRVG